MPRIGTVTVFTKLSSVTFFSQIKRTRSDNLPPPDGVIPNYVDPVNKTDLQLTVFTLSFVIAALFFLNKVYLKLFLIRKITWDDGQFLHHTYCIKTTTNRIFRYHAYSYGWFNMKVTGDVLTPRSLVL